MIRRHMQGIASFLIMMTISVHANASFNTFNGSAEGESVRVLAPLAFVKFCMHEPNECAYMRGFRSDTLNYGELNDVNRTVNTHIQPQHKVSHGRVESWVIAPRSGDCNDYAVTKRHELIRRGWASSALLLSDVETLWGERHLVLTVRTQTGPVVLDNLTDRILPVNETPYRWVKRQSVQDPNIWIRTANHGI